MPGMLFVFFFFWDQSNANRISSSRRNVKSFTWRMLDLTLYIMHTPLCPLISCTKADLNSFPKLKLTFPVAMGLSSLSKQVEYHTQNFDLPSVRKGDLFLLCCPHSRFSFSLRFLYSILYYAVNFRIKSFSQKKKKIICEKV